MSFGLSKIFVLFAAFTLVGGCGTSGSKKSDQGSGRASVDDFGGDADDSGDDLEKELGQKTSQPDREAEERASAQGRVTSADTQRLSQVRRTKDEAAILKVVSEILEKDQNHLDALNTLAIFYFEQKKYGMAKIILNRALASHASEPALHNNLGVVYLAENDLVLALESFRKSVSISSRHPAASTNLGSIYAEYNDFNRALEPLKNSYSSIRSDLRRGSPEAVDVANNYALALMGTGDARGAEKIFDDIVRSNSRNPIPYLNYAVLLVEVLKKKSDALSIISKLKFMTDDRQILRRADDLEKKLSSL